MPCGQGLLARSDEQANLPKRRKSLHHGALMIRFAGNFRRGDFAPELPQWIGARTTVAGSPRRVRFRNTGSELPPRQKEAAKSSGWT